MPLTEMQTQWNIYHPSEQERERCLSLAEELQISAASADLLVRRGITTPEQARAFVRPSMQQLHDPFLMRDMDKAVARLEQALAKNEKILVFGDYDVDGTTAVALIYTFLRTRTKQLDFYIPDRYKEGYGVSIQGIDYARDNGCTLIIALDCGIKSVNEVAYAATFGIDFIICDHHTPDEALPQAAAVLNMKRPDCNYPYKELSGCGVGFKLVQAFLQHNNLPDEELTPLLPLLAMSIASDVVPVTDENRILAYFGLRQLNLQPSVGICALLQQANIADKTLTLSDLGYKIGPRVNACGRMKSGREAVRLLITDDESFAATQAQAVEQYNLERRSAELRTLEEAKNLLEQDPDNAERFTTVVYAPDWHKGVIGIVASRLIEHYYRPAIVFTAGENGIISGSARSVAGFDIYTAIDSCSDLLTNFGGHLYAAGLSLHEKDLPEFKRRFEEYVAAHITPDQLQPVIKVENTLSFADITPQFFNVLRHLEPFGPENPKPVFVTRQVTDSRATRAVGKQGEHLRMEVTDNTAVMNGIAFGKGEEANYMKNGGVVDICYTLENNTFNGRTSIQLMVEDIKHA